MKSLGRFLLFILPALSLLWGLDVPAPVPQMAWTELIRTPSHYGSVTLGRNARVYHYDAYNGACGLWYCAYEPAGGAYQNWFTEGYNASGWSTTAFMHWDAAWDGLYAPIPALGHFAWVAVEENRDWNHIVDMHRRTFHVPAGKVVVGARLHAFSDNMASWYVNGQRVANGTGGGHHTLTIAPALLRTGTNLLAVAVTNDGACQGCNPCGLQYLLEVQLVDEATPTPTATATPTPTATPTLTPTPTATPIPVPGALTRDYPWLIWFGPQVGQPTQILRGTGFTPSGFVQLHLWCPADADGPASHCGQEAVYPLRADAAGAFVFTALDAGEADFGTPCRGAWLAWAEDWTSGLDSNSVEWVTSWFPVRRER